MSGEWLSLLVIVVVTVCFGAGAYSISRSPKFYIALAQELFPLIKGVVSKRMTPEQEKEFRQSVRRAEEWDAFRKRPKDK